MKPVFQCSILEVSLANSEEIRHDPYSKIITFKKYPSLEFCKAWIPWLHPQIPAETQTDNIPASHKKYFSHSIPSNTHNLVYLTQINCPGDQS